MLRQKSIYSLQFDSIADLYAATLRDGEYAFVFENNAIYKMEAGTLERTSNSLSDVVISQLDFTASEPAAPTEGDRYISTTAGNSSVTTQALVANSVVEWNGTDWTETTAVDGMVVYDQNEDNIYGFDGTSWEVLGGGAYPLVGQTLTDGAGTVTWDASLGASATWAVGGTGRTLTITNAEAGKFYFLKTTGTSQYSLDSMFVKQDGFGVGGVTPSALGTHYWAFFSPDGTTLVDLSWDNVELGSGTGYKAGQLRFDNETGEVSVSSNGTGSSFSLHGINSWAAAQNQLIVDSDIASLNLATQQKVTWRATDDTDRSMIAVTNFNASSSSPYIFEFTNLGTIPVTFTLPSDFKKADGTTDVTFVTVPAGGSVWHIYMGHYDGTNVVLRRMFPVDAGGSNIYTTNDSLTGARTVTMDGYDLTFSGTNSIALKDDGTVLARGFIRPQNSATAGVSITPDVSVHQNHQYNITSGSVGNITLNAPTGGSARQLYIVGFDNQDVIDRTVEFASGDFQYAKGGDLDSITLAAGDEVQLLFVGGATGTMNTLVGDNLTNTSSLNSLVTEQTLIVNSSWTPTPATDANKYIELDITQGGTTSTFTKATWGYNYCRVRVDGGSNPLTVTASGYTNTYFYDKEYHGTGTSVVLKTYDEWEFYADESTDTFFAFKISSSDYFANHQNFFIRYPESGAGEILLFSDEIDGGFNAARIIDVDTTNVTRYRRFYRQQLSAGQQMQFRFDFESVSDANHVIQLGVEGSSNSTLALIDLGTAAAGSRLLLVTDTGNQVGNFTVTEIDRGSYTLVRVDMVLAPTGALDAIADFKIDPVYNKDGSTTADGSVTGYVNLIGTDRGAPSEFVDAAVEAILIDSSGGASVETLDAGTGSGQIIFFANDDVSSNTATLTVQAGESLNGVTDGVFYFSNYADGTQFRATDIGTGEWVVSVDGASTVAPIEVITATNTDIVGVSGAGSFSYNSTNPTSGDAVINEVVYWDVAGLRHIRVNMAWDTDSDVLFQINSPLLPTGGEVISVNTLAYDTSQSGGSILGGLVTGQPNQFLINRVDSIDADTHSAFVVTVTNPSAGEVVLAGMAAPETLESGRASATSDAVISSTSFVDVTDAEVVLPKAGKYRVYYSSDWFINSTAGNGGAEHRLYNVTDGAEISGTTGELWGGSGASDNNGLIAFGEAEITVTAATTIRLQVRAIVAAGTVTRTLRGGTDAATYLGYQQLPTATVVMPDALEVEDVEVLEGDNTGLSGATQTFIDGGRTWADLASDYQGIRVEVVTNDGITWTQYIPSEQITAQAGFDPAERGTAYVRIIPDGVGTSTASITLTTWSSIDVKIYGIKAQKTVINTTDVAVDDQASSGYMDIGDMRMQWGRFEFTSAAYADITFPASFANTDFSFVANPANGSSIDQIQQDIDANRTVNSAKARALNSTTGFIDWQAIGLKP